MQLANGRLDVRVAILRRLRKQPELGRVLHRALPGIDGGVEAVVVSVDPGLHQIGAAAAADVQELPERPDNIALLKLYALYKQGTKGDVSGERPGMMAFADRAKYDAWAELAGMSSDDAKQGYIDFAEELKAR